MLKKRVSSALFLVFTGVFICALLFFSKSVSTAVRTSLSLCATSVIPSLFPFLVVTKLFIGLRLSDALPKPCKKIMMPIFSVSENSFSAFILGLISGYPIGVSVCTSLYKDKLISKRETERSLAFCNNAGPAFILSTVGVGIFSSLKIGFTLMLIHILSAVITGFLFKICAPIKTFSPKNNVSSGSASFSFAFTDAVYGATMSSLIITAYIVFFTVVITLLNQASPIYFLPSAVRSFFFGILEITSGSFEIIKSTDIKIAFVLISVLLGWGGLCVHFQALSFISGTDLGVMEYFLGKMLQALISGLLAFFISKTSLFEDVAVFADSTKHSPKSFSILIIFVLLLFFSLFIKKCWKKTSV